MAKVSNLHLKLLLMELEISLIAKRYQKLFKEFTNYFEISITIQWYQWFKLEMIRNDRHTNINIHHALNDIILIELQTT